MRLQQLFRDLAFLVLGATLALIAVGGAKDPSRARAQLPPPHLPGDDLAVLTAWMLRDPGDGVQLLDELPRGGLLPCRLPERGQLRPLRNGASALPGRIAHWIDGGPMLYLMALETPRSPFSTTGPPPPEASNDCRPGRVLVPGETVMSYLYEQSVWAAGERP